ncbi:hypothetical protein [Paracraurococcus ruber]|nr:hypothetical protein [Paracraurococcus ruber]TDG28376.1 hypothetical protein E2C05_20700 [Paracraurococcus ruber]
MQHARLFVHSSFRTSSTWFWAALRADPASYAYCEIFHEILESLQAAQVDQIHDRSWHSNHPKVEPYFREFAPLLAAEGGIPGYAKAFALQAFMPKPDGTLPDGQRAYVQALLDWPERLGRTPVLTCTRTLGRVGALKRAFGGWHILLHRNLFQQWISYLHQAETGNGYFLGTVREIILADAGDPVLAALRPCIAADAAGGFHGYRGEDDAFRAFMGFHLSLSMRAAADADRVVDANRLAVDGEDRRALEAALRDRVGLTVDLSSAREQIEFPGLRLSRRWPLDAALRDVFAAAARQVAGLSLPDGMPAAAFGQRLLDDAAAEEARWAFYTRGVLGHVRRIKAEGARTPCETAAACPAALAEIARVRAECAAAAARSAAAVDALHARLAAAHAAQARAEARSQALRAEADTIRQGYEARLAASRDRLSAIEQSTIWRATRPLRRIGGHLPPGLRRLLRRAGRTLRRPG